MHLTLAEIDKLVNDLDTDSKAVKDELFKLCWFMRGSMSISEAYELAIEDREIIVKLIEGNIETTKESGLPFF